MDVTRIPPGRNPPDDINVLVEIPQGGVPVKYELDKASGALFVNRFLHTAMYYPANYGFIPKYSRPGRRPNRRACAVTGAGRARRSHQMPSGGRADDEDENGIDEKILAVPVDELNRLRRNRELHRPARDPARPDRSLFPPLQGAREGQVGESWRMGRSRGRPASSSSRRSIACEESNSARPRCSGGACSPRITAAESLAGRRRQRYQLRDVALDQRLDCCRSDRSASPSLCETTARTAVRFLLHIEPRLLDGQHFVEFLLRGVIGQIVVILREFLELERDDPRPCPSPLREASSTGQNFAASSELRFMLAPTVALRCARAAARSSCFGASVRTRSA